MKTSRSVGTSLVLLLDTQILVWIGTGDRRLSAVARAAIIDPDAELCVSAIVAYEFEDLRIRDRLGPVDALGDMLRRLDAVVLDFPAEAYRLIPLLPKLHREPVDRMLVAHAIHADLTLVTADATIRQYPVRTLW